MYFHSPTQCYNYLSHEYSISLLTICQIILIIIFIIFSTFQINNDRVGLAGVSSVLISFQFSILSLLLDFIPKLLSYSIQQKLILLSDNIKMSSIDVILLLFLLKLFLFRQQFTLNAQFNSCGPIPSNSFIYSQKRIIDSTKLPQLKQNPFSQANPTFHKEYIGSFHIRSNQIIQSSTLELCPIVFIPDQSIQISLSVEPQKGQQVKTNKITFYPQQNKCHTIDILSLDFQTIIDGQNIIYKIKSSCQGKTKQQKTIKIQINYKKTVISFFILIKQIITKLAMAIICLIFLVKCLFRSYCIDDQEDTKNNGEKQDEIIRQFDSIMPSFMQADHQNGEIQCSICLLPINEEEEMRLTPCKHSFHKVCIDRWGMKKLLCPICRGSLSIFSLLRKHSNDQ